MVFISGLFGDQYVGLQFGSVKKFVSDGGMLVLSKLIELLEVMLGKFFGVGVLVDNLGGIYMVKVCFINVGVFLLGVLVKMVGVVIGSVQLVQVDLVKFDVLVILVIDKKYDQILDDFLVVVFISGLIGSQYVVV